MCRCRGRNFSISSNVHIFIHSNRHFFTNAGTRVHYTTTFAHILLLIRFFFIYFLFPFLYVQEAAGANGTNNVCVKNHCASSIEIGKIWKMPFISWTRDIYIILCTGSTCGVFREHLARTGYTYFHFRTWSNIQQTQCTEYPNGLISMLAAWSRLILRPRMWLATRKRRRTKYLLHLRHSNESVHISKRVTNLLSKSMAFICHEEQTKNASWFPSNMPRAHENKILCFIFFFCVIIIVLYYWHVWCREGFWEFWLSVQSSRVMVTLFGTEDKGQ